jgi:hypothetical protein
MSPYPTPLNVDTGRSLMLVLEPYREFVSQLAVDSIDSKTLEVSVHFLLFVPYC